MITNAKENERGLKHYVTYLIFGILTTTISIGTFWLFRTLCPSLDENISNMLSITIAIIFAYYTNRKYVFESNVENKEKDKEFIKFFISREISFVLEVVLFWAINKYTKIDELIIKTFCTGLIIILNYILSRFFVFRKNNEKKN